jgi:type I restriction enzyme S subunit
VAKVDELMALCDRLEAARAGREAVRDRLTAATWVRLTAPETDAETFPAQARFALQTLTTLTTRPDQIRTLRQTILNLAVRGKLVEQDPTDESAAELLKRIEKERATKAKSAKVRAKRPIPFADQTSIASLPDSWRIEAIGNLVDPTATISYGVLVPGPDVTDGIPFVRAQDLALSDHPARPNKTIAPEIEAPYARTRLRGGEILLCVVGSIGKLGIAPQSWAGANIARAVARIAPVESISSNYLLLAMRSDLIQTYCAEATRTLAQPTLNVGLIEVLPIPLPPLAEQHRIVATVDALMALCDQLESSLTTATITRSRLLEALLHEALGSTLVTEAA